ncbi:MAG: DUF4238 domain-containing protein [Mastigocoleus sp. MO_167.B18]|uniref:DUF4238 domain-containing protein n=1 Tax=Mastigocoleus sp. MO_188.B34 TaxID=3036635 RepID=UPI00261DF5BE|nr:DUF4238 domain-containing protein [Mastigocoleus sp. MO_188.B34]MDJ0696874.1 DUF4238 domain-containing protein [Mastigocoleus sp. MO_188.B34]MDJ0773901.1 DUF4238 domain-containing protein [Mastigocoleus sp. MO_167.B18]
MNKQITKNQHYVPQCLLKHFANGKKKSKKKINIFDTYRSELRYNQPIKNAFSENYFYDKDNQTEDFLANQIETPASRIIDKIINGNFDLVNKEKLILQHFILSLFYRTPEASERASLFVNSHLESVVRQLLSLNGFDPEMASAGSFNFHPDHLASLLAFQGVIDAVLLEDLKYHIIKNETQLEFYISDHPVFIYNWLYRDLEHPEVTSIAATGLQVFLPLSPKITLCLYDPKVYKYGQSSRLVTCIDNNNDIEILNSFQIINSDSFIGFYSKQSETCLKRLYERYKNVRLHQYESDILSTNKEAKGKIKSTHSSFTKQAKLRKKPSFIKIKKKFKGCALSYQERDPDLACIHREYMKQIHEQKQHSIIELDRNKRK